MLTNVQVDPSYLPELMARASRTVADLLGKPESYVMVILESGRDLLFGGSAEPAAYLELKSLNLPESRTPEGSRGLCGPLADTPAVPAERDYIENTAPPPQRPSRERHHALSARRSRSS